jgi:nucleoporin NUP82
LQKLANAKNDGENLGASQYGATKGFSPDAADLEVASACFGDSPDQEGVHGWAPMTLWIATVSGDVYALCPLLPSRWQLVNSAGADTFQQTLITTININHANLTEDDSSPAEDMALADKQIKWLSDIIYQESFTEQLANDDVVTVFNRPASVPAVPLLQGPFSIVPEVEEFELSDMVVYSLKTFSEGGDEEIAEGLPSAVVCLLTDTCEVHVCLDLEGIIGRWLPSAEDDYVPEPSQHILTVVETIALANDGVSSPYQSITPDVRADFSFFVSHASGVFYISLEPWIRRLENELYEPQMEGAEFRLQRLLESANTVAERCMRRNPRDTKKDVTSCVVIDETSVGYMVLTTFDDEPQAVFLDAPTGEAPTDEELQEYMQWPAVQSDNREPWQPPRELWQPFNLRASLQPYRRSRSSWDEQINLSPANLQVLMAAHRVLAEHTETLQLRVSDLFNRCQRLQDEYRDQINRAAEVSQKVDTVTGRDESPSDGGVYGNKKMEERLEKVQAKQEAQKQRYLALRRKMASVNTSQLSEKEVQFVEELHTMEGSVDKTAQRLTDNADGSETPVWERMDKVKSVQQTLSKEVEGGVQAASEQRPGSSMKVPSHSRKMEHEQIQAMLQHQKELLQATADRLRSNGIAMPAAVDGLGS